MNLFPAAAPARPSTAMASTLLPPAPRQLVHERGIPAFGVYQGIIERLDWRALKTTPYQRLTRRLHHKRWQYAAIAHPAFFIGVAIVDVGWTGTAFAYLFDRKSGEVIAAASANGLPGLSTRIEDRAFGDAAFQAGRCRLSFRRDGERLELAVDSPQLKLAAHIQLTDMPPVLAVIAPANWLAHSTHKSGGLRISGFADCQDRRYSLDGAVAALDYSNGLLARETRWRWASAHSLELGFNLQQGYMGDTENAAWLRGKLIRLGPVRFDYQPEDPLLGWRMRSDNGLLDLSFAPEGARREDKNLLIAASRYVQPIGRFNGQIRDPDDGAVHVVDDLLGVTEDHLSRW
ncbi:DUF2804 domain-containing protein [Chromobacterium sp. S0633]|uniref:DUF2804 domain-containing protein n=1 Tax=Chromobacterium sp. S0633 TaxID=2957805 RepID=UPI00209DD504|nr:DUF2804 domain-containing protein [Chromobacterium sp. S0633]MCP1289538.1 DUF2804 domain-containing protein [Chromobacterium sp. S0633]